MNAEQGEVRVRPSRAALMEEERRAVEHEEVARQQPERRQRRRQSTPEAPPYAMRLDWDPEDRIYVVTVPQLQGCVTHGRTRAEAVRRGEEAIASWLGAAERFGDPIPEPSAPTAVITGEALADLAHRVSHLSPDVENLPEWVLAEFRDVVGVYQRLPDKDRVIIDRAFDAERLPLWLIHLSARLLAAHQHLTGETLPAAVILAPPEGKPAP
jgi:predicted RNase H-like HicB family nuclease